MQLKIIEIYTSGCFLYCKDTKMKANHNACHEEMCCRLYKTYIF